MTKQHLLKICKYRLRIWYSSGGLSNTHKALSSTPRIAKTKEYVSTIQICIIIPLKTKLLVEVHVNNELKILVY